MNKVIVIGHSPNPNKTTETSPTLCKVRKWMINAGVDKYDFVTVEEIAIQNMPAFFADNMPNGAFSTTMQLDFFLRNFLAASKYGSG